MPLAEDNTVNSCNQVHSQGHKGSTKLPEWTPKVETASGTHVGKMCGRSLSVSWAAQTTLCVGLFDAAGRQIQPPFSAFQRKVF